ncbi:hypothetical protein WG901_14715 [Novosphingobium sp. PS1R-30]|uniref:Secreted protein n=1 Tax=Novosphingobium anseongense TaxID=3133436 RepID=A0ABU8RYV0_9SPHN|nr:MAG: hypothetical protein EOO76_04045 [Novosphingobium sp.]
MRTNLKALAAAGLVAAKLALVVTLVGHHPVEAAARGGSNVVSLTNPLEAPRQAIVGGVLWKCAGSNCAAPADGSRPVLVCQRVAKTFGPIARFTSPAGELSSEDLSRCNGQS